jgi:pyruvate/2-oxoglutarate dehydrogenase complex dihydrolipoamide dehydrogenase (E3) component
MKYEAIVLGSGQAGSPLAFALAGKGMAVALVEKAHLGGTCVNTGCTPTKTMVARAQVAYYARNAERWGVSARDVKVDLETLVAQKNKIVLNARGSQEKRVGQLPSLRLYQGRAEFTGPHQVKVGDDLIESDRIFINTGARPSIPAVPGLSQAPYLTNETIMELTTVPEHLVILGGGYVGLEFGQMFARFGSKVTIVQRDAQIVPREDADVAAELQKALVAEGITILLGMQTTKVESKDGSIELTAEGPSGNHTISGSHLLVAAGRRPNTDDLGLVKAGIQTDKDGFIEVNNKLETSVPGVWALGDVKGGPAFTHISYNDYQIVYANVFEGKNLSIENRIVGYCVFTDPQLGGVGLTEKEAREKGYELKIGKVPMTRVSRAIERDETAGLMKLIVDAKNDQILGATILSSDGGETVHILYTLMLAKQPYTLMKSAVYIHPTLAEGLFFLIDDVKPVTA